MFLERLRDLREDNDLLQKQVASQLGIPERTYGNYEMGVRKLPLDILIALAKLYKTSTDYILGITDTKTPYPPTRL